MNNDEDSDAQKRAERVKKVRNMANLTRKQMCDKSSIKPQTLIGWEIARHGGLSKVGANKIIECVAKEGVICTFDWLYHGTGQGPTVIPDFRATQPTNISVSFPDDKEHINILEELNLFKLHYKQAIEYLVEDNTMLPHFQKGDYVAGIKYFGSDIAKFLDQNFLVVLDDGKSLLRLLKPGNGENCYTLVCLNYQSASTPIMHNVKLSCVAPILWHRKPSIMSRIKLNKETESYE